MRRLAIVLALALAPACKKDAPASEQQSGAKHDAGAIAERVAVFLATKQVGELDVGKASTYVPLHSMMPPEFANLESWASIEVKTVRGHGQTLVAPAKTHPGEVAALFATEGGIALGFFAPADVAKKGKPKLTIPGVTEVRVQVPEMAPGQGGGDGGGGGEEGGERPVPTADLKIEINLGGVDTMFTGDQLAKIPTTTAPIGDMDTPGWTLPAVLKAAGVDVKSLKGKVVMYGDEGANLILEPGDLDNVNTVAFIKLNRQGKLRFRLFKKAGATWDVTGELRGIASIESGK